MRRVLVVLLVLLLPGMLASPARAAAYPSTIRVPVDFAPEGIATGPGATFYVGSITEGDIYRGDLRTGRGSLFVDAPEGFSALGLKVDAARGVLLVAGGLTGAVHAYSTTTGTHLASVQLAQPGSALLNDLVVARDTVWVTNSFAPVLYRIPLSPTGVLGAPTALGVTGPAATTSQGFNLNGIDATPNGKTLLVSHSDLGQLFTVDPATGASALIEVDGLVAGTLDGLLLQGRTLWVVQNFASTLVAVTLTPDLRSGVITRTITDDAFQVPATVARHGNRLALVNTRFDLGFPPPFGPGAPAGTTFDVVVVRG